jgi:hypothetical protein|tara:strand:- start:17391 stop:17714 length:324 start_codon:yes stop_codon:yes gene_type:complete
MNTKGQMGRDKKAPNPPSRASLLKLARSVVAEVSDTKETRPQQHYTKEVKLLRKKLKELGFKHTMTDGKTGTNTVTLAQSLLKQIPSSATSDVLKSAKKQYGSLNGS